MAQTVARKLLRAPDGHVRLPDVTVLPVDAHSGIADLALHAFSRSVAQIVRHDPGVRLGEDAEDVHQFRVACRRLRSDIRTFGPLFDSEPDPGIRSELAWLAGQVGAVRDADVLTDRIGTMAATLPEADARGAALLLGLVEEDASAARARLLEDLEDQRYLMLLDCLERLATNKPSLERSTAKRRPTRQAARIVRRPWKRLTSAVGDAGPEASDAELHRIRILAKRCRYAAEAVAPLIGAPASRFAAAVADVQTVLGDHQDTVVAEEWLRAAALHRRDTAFAAGELVALERARRAEFRRQWPAVWRRASSKKLLRWL